MTRTARLPHASQYTRPMSRILRLAALACLASIALAMPASQARAQQQPVGRPPAPAPPAQPAPTVQPPGAIPPPGLPELPVTEPAPAPIVTTPPMTTVQVERYWYLLMLADLSWLWASIRLNEENLALLGYPALAPSVHVLMDNGRGALESVALRIAVGGLTYLYVWADDSEDDDVLLRGGVFLGAAAVFDWFYLARRFKTVPLPARGRESSTWTWMPSVLAGEQSLQLGVSGAF
jgi:hypothetical protein